MAHLFGKIEEKSYICGKSKEKGDMEFKKLLKITLKVVGALLVLVLAALGGALLYVNSSTGQQRLLHYATDLLQEKLQTRVQIDSVCVKFSTLDIDLMGLDVEDQQQRHMLQAEHLAVKLDLKDLLVNKVEISSVKLSGIQARVYQPKDSAANYQFIIDAFKTDKKKEPKTKQKLTLDLKYLQVTDLSALYNDDSLAVDRLVYEHRLIGGQKATISGLRCKMDRLTKKGFNQTNSIGLAEAKVNIKGKKYEVTIDSLHYATNNHQPRKNANKPKRGFFDAGHLDITANMQLDVELVSKDSTLVTLNRCTASDPTTGIHISELRLKAGINKQTASLQDIFIKHLNTQLHIDGATVQLPSKKTGRKLQYATTTITGRTVLKDISRPFAPALGRFTIPLELRLTMSGTDSTMKFNGVHVNTPDQKLKIAAKGYIRNLKDAKQLKIHFDVNPMTTNATTAKRIIDQFTVKKFMMRQMNNLGAIGYRGSVDIVYKMEKFNGTLSTSKGNMGVSLVLNENTKYLTGSVRTKGFRLGQVIEMKDIGDVECVADFCFDYSKPRTARVRKLRGGKLPIGWVKVTGVRGSYKKIKLSDISASIKSDGVVAEGHIQQTKKMADLMCDFTFNNTDSIHKMKIKPGMRLKNMPWQKKNLTDEERDKAKQAKLKAKQEKAAAKQEKAAAKEEEKKAKAALKAEKKAAKKAEKEQRKAEKTAAKAAKNQKIN